MFPLSAAIRLRGQSIPPARSEGTGVYRVLGKMVALPTMPALIGRGKAKRAGLS